MLNSSVSALTAQVSAPCGRRKFTTSSQYLIFPPAPRSGIGVLALYPPQPLLHKLQTDKSYGINIAMVAQNINGLGFSLPEYLSQALGDRIEVFLDRPDVTNPSSVIDFALTEDDFEADGKTPKTVLFTLQLKPSRRNSCRLPTSGWIAG